MANREIEAILRISSKLGNMRALGTLTGKLNRVKKQTEAFNRANVAMVSRSARTLTATQQAAITNLRRMDAEAAHRRRAAVVAANRDGSSVIGTYKTMAKMAAPFITGAAVVGSVKSYGAIERQIGRIGATAEASVGETEVFGQRLRTVASDLRVPFQQVVEGADELAASGKNIDQINKLLPSVARAAHASGAEFKDMATTADAVSNALKITEAQMERAFDVLAYGGKVGKFELKDMAAELPSLLPAFAALGYTGEEGLKRIVAMLQGVRMETGQSGEAATAMMDIFTKMESLTVTNNFKKFGVDLRKSLAQARREGKDVVDVFMDLAVQAVKGDLSKLPQLFTDKQMLIGMRALINQREQVKAWQADMSNAAGTVAADWKRFATDTQASLDVLGNSWDRLGASVGKAVARGGAVAAMDWTSEWIDEREAISAYLEAQGKGFWARSDWFSRATAADIRNASWRSGYRRPGEQKMIDAYGEYGRARSRADALARITPPRPKDRFGMPAEGPIPEPRPDFARAMPASQPPEKLAPPRPKDRFGMPAEGPIPEPRPDFARAMPASQPPEKLAPPRPKDRFGMPAEGPIPEPRPDFARAMPSIPPAPAPTAFDLEWRDQMMKASRRKRRPFAEARGIGGMATLSSGDDAYDEFLRAARMDVGDVDEQRRAGARFLAGDAGDGKTFREAMQFPATGFGGEKIDETLAKGGEEAGRAFRQEAARAANEIGEDGGSAFNRMLQGMAPAIGREIGAAAAREIRSGVGNLSVNVNGGAGSGPAGANVNPGRTMPDAGRAGPQ